MFDIKQISLSRWLEMSYIIFCYLSSFSIHLSISYRLKLLVVTQHTVLDLKSGLRSIHAHVLMDHLVPRTRWLKKQKSSLEFIMIPRKCNNLINEL